MNHSDTTLAAMLREQLEGQIEKSIQDLIKAPNDRRAGRIEAFQEVLGLVNGTYSQLNDMRSTQEKK